MKYILQEIISNIPEYPGIYGSSFKMKFDTPVENGSVLRSNLGTCIIVGRLVEGYYTCMILRLDNNLYLTEEEIKEGAEFELVLPLYSE